MSNSEEKDTMQIESFVKKISIQLYLISKEIEKIKTDDKKEISLISKKLSKIDKDILKKFNIKLSDSTKESALEILKILK